MNRSSQTESFPGPSTSVYRWVLDGLRKRLHPAGVVALLCIIGLFFACGVWETRDKNEMLRITLDWGRLASPPKSAQNLIVATEGSMFTRAFRASFSAPLVDIDRWLRESPGTRDVTPERPSPTRRRFLISPGGGAQHAEVTVEDSSGRVAIYVYWS